MQVAAGPSCRLRRPQIRPEVLAARPGSPAPGVGGLREPRSISCAGCAARKGQGCGAAGHTAGRSHLASAASGPAVRGWEGPTQAFGAVCRLPQSGDRQRNSGGCPSSPSPAPHKSVFPSVSLVPPELPAQHRRPGPVPERVGISPLRGRLGFLVPSASPGRPESPLILAVRFCGSSLSRGWDSGLGAPGWG